MQLTVVQLHSLRFRGEGTAAPIPLRDPSTNEWIAAQPEWIARLRSQPVAYVRGKTPSVEIGLVAGWFGPRTFHVSAWGVPFDGGPPVCVVGPHRVVLSEQDLRATFVSAGTAPFNVPLPDHVGRHVVDLDWYAEWEADGHPMKLFLGHSSQVMCSTWKKMVDDHDAGLDPWAYSTVMEWSCAWARGATAPKPICDQLLANLPASGLQYGLPIWDVRAMLAGGGGMCGGWYQLFAQLANCQGVRLSLQTMMVPAGDEARWAALVVSAPGLNQIAPSSSVGVEGHYRDTGQWPPPPPQTIAAQTTGRYYFGPDPDGHCVNMLDEGNGTVVIYDPSYLRSAAGIRMDPPPSSGKVDRYRRAARFRTAYFDRAIQFLMSQHDVIPDDPDPLAFGVTVETRVIPEIVIIWNQVPTRAVARERALEKVRRLVDAYVPHAEAAAWRARIEALAKGAGTAPQSVLTALEAAKKTRLRRDAPVPHSMPPAELLQHAMLELAHPAEPVVEANGVTLEDVHEEAISPRLREQVRRVLARARGAGRSE